ncbi:MAG: hypothetical protein HYT42_01985 [Candidatus Sungbacteria bacterium]|nr:hypothetical protein [Candidatus Sungbacteria bacterium]
MAKRVNPEWPLRIGLGLMYVYSGLGFIRNPFDWQGFLPQWFLERVQAFAPVETYLRFQGIAELAIAFLMLGWFLPRSCVRLAALAAVLEFLFILIFVPIDLVTFRDIGLLGGALSLLLLSRREAASGYLKMKNE